MQSINPQYSPGQVAPQSGVYTVRHYAHRLPHNAYINEGTVFPECRTCQHRVQFLAVLVGVTELAHDPDFAEITQAAAASEIA
jgi:hypothetical protein